MPPGIRILLLADTHLGFDLPVRPRVERRRRGHDFLKNYAIALEPAVRAIVADVPADAVLSIRLTGELTQDHWQVVSAPRMRATVPTTMNVEITPPAQAQPR